MEPTVQVAVIGGFIALATAVVSWLINKRSVAVVELEAALGRLSKEVADLRALNREKDETITKLHDRLTEAERHIRDLEKGWRA